jgi:tetratricopeptide (TPR) repeat protein
VYCRTMMGNSGAADDHLAASLPTDFIFPSSAEDLTVLRAAAKANAADANVHYLLGTLYFSRGLTDEGLSEWAQARKLNPKIPVLDASLGLGLLHAKHDPEAALEAFREGIQNDQRNEVVYIGADQSLSILRKPGKERVQALELYPDLAQMPAQLVFELALNLAESGDFDRATALFRNRFFPREEGGTNVRQVWLELQLQRALDQAKNKRCGEATTIANGMGSPVQDIAFTNDGLQPFLESARTKYLLGQMYSQCGKPEEARQNFESAAGKSDAGEIIWAWFAARQLPAFNQSQWTARLESALEQVTATSETSGLSGLSAYKSAMLNRALGREHEAQQGFRQVFLLPDNLLSYHLTREALAAQ